MVPTNFLSAGLYDQVLCVTGFQEVKTAHMFAMGVQYH
jgi:hypothetical protein